MISMELHVMGAAAWTGGFGAIVVLLIILSSISLGGVLADRKSVV